MTALFFGRVSGKVFTPEKSLFLPPKNLRMKITRDTIVAIIILLVAAALYRVWDGRPFGFTPHIAMAIFGGAVIRNKWLAFFMPLVAMLVSDCIYQLLYLNGATPIAGFYEGQWVNYLLFAGLTLFGFLMRKINLVNVLGFSVSGSLLFFLFSNFTVWLGGGGLARPKTWEGLMQCYGDGLAFYRDYGLFNGFYGNIFIGDLFFMLLFFGAFVVFGKIVQSPRSVQAS
jgi:hypothetical protein